MSKNIPTITPALIENVSQLLAAYTGAVTPDDLTQTEREYLGFAVPPKSPAEATDVVIGLVEHPRD